MVRDVKPQRGGQLRHRRAGAQHRVRPQVQHHRHAHAGVRRRHAARRAPSAPRRSRSCSPPPSMMAPLPRGASIHYRVECADLHAHLFASRSASTSPRPSSACRCRSGFRAATWCASSPSTCRACARQQGRAIAGSQQLDKCSWQIECVPGSPLMLSYEVYAYDNSVRTAWLDTERGFFNGTSLCLRVEGQDRCAARARAAGAACRRWRALACATALAPHKVDKRGFGTTSRPTTTSWPTARSRWAPSGAREFEACGVPHRFVVAGAARLASTANACWPTRTPSARRRSRFWHGDRSASAAAKPPLERYVFMLNVVDDGYGGLEHRDSHRADLRRGATCRGRARHA